MNLLFCCHYKAVYIWLNKIITFQSNCLGHCFVNDVSFINNSSYFMLVRTVTRRVTPLLRTRTSSLFVIMPMLILTLADFPGFSCNFIFPISLSVKIFASIAFLLRTKLRDGLAFVEVIKDKVKGTRDCCRHRLHSPK